MKHIGVGAVCTGWSGHGLTTFQQLKENLLGQLTVYK